MAKDKGGTSLLRSIGLSMAIILVMSSIIGTGVFVKAAKMSHTLHSGPLELLAWALAGVIILFGVWSIGELAAMFPSAGGPYVWLEKIYGKLISFLYGWSCFTVIQSAAIASVAFIFARALGTFVTLPQLPPSIQTMTLIGIPVFKNIGAKGVACILIIGLTIVNIKGIKKGGLVSQVFTFIIVVCLSFIFCSAVFTSFGSWDTFLTPGKDYPASGYSTGRFISLMFLAMTGAFWGYEGWIALGFIGEEIKKPRKNLPRALTIGILLITFFYLLVNWAYLYVIPVDDLARGFFHDRENYIAAVAIMDKIFGNRGAYIISGMILISTFGCTNATALLSARIYYAMGREGLFFKGVEKVHYKNKTPHKSLIFQCVWACILTLSGSFDILTGLVIFAAFVFYGLIVFGVVILRIKRKKQERPYKALGFPVIPVVFTLFCLVLLIISIKEEPTKSLIGLSLILSGLPFYFYWRNGKRHQQYLAQSKEETRDSKT